MGGVEFLQACRNRNAAVAHRLTAPGRNLRFAAFIRRVDMTRAPLIRPSGTFSPQSGEKGYITLPGARERQSRCFSCSPHGRECSWMSFSPHRWECCWMSFSPRCGEYCWVSFSPRCGEYCWVSFSPRCGEYCWVSFSPRCGEKVAEGRMRGKIRLGLTDWHSGRGMCRRLRTICLSLPITRWHVPTRRL
jgi:hypothetical protein